MLIFLAQFQQAFNDAVADHSVLYITDATNIFQTYLDNLNPDIRQYHTCRTCNQFFDRYGSLVTLSDTGQIKPVMWTLMSTHSDLLPAIIACYNRVMKANVIGVHVDTTKMWGLSQTESHNGTIWTHLHVVPPSRLCTKHTHLLSDSQARAVKKSSFGDVANYLYDVNLVDLKRAKAIVTSDQCFRSDPVIGGLEFLIDLKQRVDNEKNTKLKLNLIWRAVGTSPEGFCHPRSSMVGYLIESIQQELSNSQILSRFNEAMQPEKYRRPTAAPAEQLIDRAEAIVKEQGLERSFERRFATLKEVQKIWVPTRLEPHPDNSFFHKLKKSVNETLVVSGVSQKMTWAKFDNTVLPKAEQVEVYVNARGNHFGALVTAVHDDAKPIIQWDLEDNRNPVSWYVHVHAVSANNMGLEPGWTKVTGVSLQPNLWNDPERFKHQGYAVFFLLEGAMDRAYLANPEGAALFPQIIKQEYHSILRVIEAYSNKSEIQRPDLATACGIRLAADSKIRIGILEYAY
jgi:hypothetical protein